MTFDPQDAVDAPQINESEAVSRVLAVLESTKKRAFGFNDDNWEESIYDLYLFKKCRDLAIALLKNDQQALREISDYLRRCVEFHANEWLAEADADELESEGFLL